MRKIFKFSLLALFISFASCEDATDIVQESELNDDAAYRTLEDLESGLNGVYAQYGPDFGSNGQGDIFLFNDLFTDNLKRGESNLGQGSEEYNFVMQPGSNVPTTVWGNRYAAINFANRTLRAWDRIAPGLTAAADIAEANRIRAELLAMRALCHFDLLSYFAPSYTDRNAPGVIIMNFVPEINEDFPRNSVGEVFDFINEDLTAAAELIAGSDRGKFYVNADVIKAIHARVALFEGNYTLAKTFASELADEYPLMAAGPYLNMWINDDPATMTEAIFILARLQNDNGVAGNWYANRVDLEGSPFLEMSNQLFDLYDLDDVRRTAFVDDSSPVLFEDTDRRILIGKYPGSGRGQLINHIKLFRGSEMVLIEAETEARTGNLVAAAAALKTLTDARWTNPATAPDQLVFADLDDALEAIMLERRKELAFEGHRYLDIKRLGAEVNVGVSRDSRDCGSFSAPCDIAATDYRFTLPIPQTEISSNPTIQQNPGY